MAPPCEPLTERQELVATLEELGFDCTAERPYGDWRSSMTDGELRAAISRFEDAEAAHAR